MLISIALALLTLRAGLALRRARLGRAPRDPGLRRRHLRLAKPAVVMILVGFVAGPVSAIWLRGWEPFRSFHGVLGLGVATLFAAAALLGRRLERGRSRAFEAHARLGALAVLGAAIAAVAGFVLLP
jgi:Protein of unknown function (DUF4079)/Eukaryotic cytochrome b561